MRKNFIYIFLALIIGALFAFYVFKGINITLADSIRDNFVNFYQIGVFRKYNNAYKLHDKYPESKIFKDESFYYVYIGMAYDEEIGLFYEKYYQTNNINYYKKRVKINGKCLSKIKDYEKLVNKNMKDDLISSYNKNVLYIYQKECL